MTFKPKQIINRITKATGQRQSVLIVGNWQEELITQVKENQNNIQQLDPRDLSNNSFTRIISDYQSSDLFYSEARRLLLPKGLLIMSANCEDSIFTKILKVFKRTYIKEGVIKIKPKTLQDKIHDHGFLIEGYYGYPGGHLLMIAEIQNKEVLTLFTSDKQETIKI